MSSESSRLAARLAGTQGLGVEELVLLNVVEMGPQIGFASDGFERMVAWRRDAEASLRELREQVQAAGIRCRCRLELGKPSLEILRVAEEERVALIAMGSHAHGPMRRLLRRSVTGAVVGGADCPVLVVPFPAGKRLETEGGVLAARLFRRVLLATDFSDAAEGALGVVKGVPAGEVGEVVVLFVGDGRPGPRNPPRDRMDRIAAELRYFGFTVTCEAQRGKLTSAVAEVLRVHDVSLVVIASGSGRRPGGPRAARVAGAVRRASDRPVLIVPAE